MRWETLASDDLPVGLVGDLDDAARLEVPGTWGGYTASTRFRLHRFAAHLREHTIQIEKTLAMLQKQTTEVARIVLAAYGRLEATVLCLPEDLLDRALGDRGSLSGLLTANEVAAVTGSIGA